MAFIEDMQGRDLTLLQTLDGRTITYTPDGGSPRTVAGMLQSYSEITGGESVDVIINSPILSVRGIDVPEIAEGDQFNIDGKDYTAAAVRSDNEGITEIMLEES